MNIDEVFRVVGRLYLESQVTVDRLTGEIEKLRTELKQFGEATAKVPKVTDIGEYR